jgi:hypothetical protein
MPACEIRICAGAMMVMAGDQSEPFPATTLMSLDGDDARARADAVAEWERVAARLEQTTQQSVVDKVFTAHLLPDDARLPAAYSPEALRAALIQVQFPWDSADLLAQVARREIEHLFSTGGEDAARSLITAIDHSVLVRRLDAGATPDLPFANAIPFVSPQQEVEAARRCREACQVELRRVQAIAAKTVATIQESAAALADASLGAALSEVYAEAARYLDIRGLGRRATATDVVESDVPLSRVVLEGPDIAPMIGALRSIHARRRTLAQLTDELATVRAQPMSSSRTAELSIEVTDASDDLTLAVLVEAGRFPILHRLWRGPDVPSAVTVLPAREKSAEGVATTADDAPGVRAAAEWLASLKQRIWTSVRDTAANNRAFTSSLSGTPEHVWRYPPLISRALEQRAVRDPSIQFRAAEDRLTAEKSTLLQTLNLVSAGIQMAAWLTSPEPPVALVLAVVGGGLGLAQTAEDFLTKLEADEAFHSVFDPGKAVASEPGYLGIVVAVAFSVLDLKGVRDAYRAVAAAETTASTAIRLVAP